MGTYGDIKLCVANVITSVCGLYNHFLPFDGAAREGKLVACAASWVVGVDGSKSIGQLVVYSPRALVAAHVGWIAYQHSRVM